MATAKKEDFMTLTRYLKLADVKGVTAVALDRAISQAIGEGTLTDMYPSTSKAEKYTIDANGKVEVGMPTEGGGYQSYRNDYLILNEDEFDKWYTEDFRARSSKAASGPKEVSLAELHAMTPEERAEHFKRIQENKGKQKAATSVGLKKEKEVKALLNAGKFDEAEKLLKEWGARGADNSALKSGLLEDIKKARRNAEE